MDIKYRRPARLGEDLLVVSTVQQVRASSVDIQQRVMRGAEVLTDAKVTAAFLDGTAGRAASRKNGSKSSTPSSSAAIMKRIFSMHPCRLHGRAAPRRSSPARRHRR